MRYFLLAAVLTLAACGTPEERCARQVTNEIGTLDRLIAETEANIARGYTYVYEPSNFRVSIGGCTGRYDSVRFCGWNEPQYRRRAQAIDPEAERRKLADLQSRRTALQSNSRAAFEACGITVVN
jgi:hypothetical protein